MYFEVYFQLKNSIHYFVNHVFDNSNLRFIQLFTYTVVSLLQFFSVVYEYLLVQYVWRREINSLTIYHN